MQKRKKENCRILTDRKFWHLCKTRWIKSISFPSVFKGGKLYFEEASKCHNCKQCWLEFRAASLVHHVFGKISKSSVPPLFLCHAIMQHQTKVTRQSKAKTSRHHIPLNISNPPPRGPYVLAVAFHANAITISWHMVGHRDPSPPREKKN